MIGNIFHHVDFSIFWTIPWTGYLKSATNGFEDVRTDGAHKACCQVVFERGLEQLKSVMSFEFHSHHRGQ